MGSVAEEFQGEDAMPGRSASAGRRRLPARFRSRYRAVIGCCVLLAACATPPAGDGDAHAQRQEIEQHLALGQKLLIERSTLRATAEFAQAIALCEERYGASGRKVYASRGQAETIYYMVLAASTKTDAMAVDTTCADAHYLMGYASLDLGRVEEAEAQLRAAVELAPVNAMYLAELGHIYQTQLDWQNALETFSKAEEYAGSFSPEELRVRELARAKRGAGYNLIELGRLDEAEQKFRECLELDAGDQAALNELRYIENLRQNGASP